MRLVKMSDLITRCQQRADQENQTFVNNTTGVSEWQHYIHTAYAELYGEICKTGLRHFEKVQAITTDGGAVYKLPNDFLSTVGVDYVATDGTRNQLAEMMVQERNRYSGSSGASSAVMYAIEGSGFATGSKPLKLYPTPPSAQTYEHLYIPQPKDLTKVAGTTRIDVVCPDGEAFIVWSVAFLAIDKEESDTTNAEKERERLRAEVVEWARLRAFNQPRRLVVSEEIEEPYAGGFWPEGY